jgi:hypothetical protein
MINKTNPATSLIASASLDVGFGDAGIEIIGRVPLVVSAGAFMPTCWGALLSHP